MRARALVYLAGPISGQSYDAATNWRADAMSMLGSVGIVGLSPLRGKEFLSNEDYIEGTYEHNHLGTAKGITTRDRLDVRNCDVVLMNLVGAKKVSIGTMIEVGWADAFGKPIVLVMENGNLHEHPILETITHFRTDTIHEAVGIVKAILL